MVEYLAKRIARSGFFFATVVNVLRTISVLTRFGFFLLLEVCNDSLNTIDVQCI